VKFKIDENLPVLVAEVLRQSGHEAHTVQEEGLGGSNDQIVARAILAEGRALVTLDLDFADVRVYPPANYGGIIVIRGKKGQTVISRVMPVILEALKREPLKGCLWIVQANRIRIRRFDGLKDSNSD
jgi:predicted nuclease of predicted toxin-antitoxin system